MLFFGREPRRSDRSPVSSLSPAVGTAAQPLCRWPEETANPRVAGTLSPRSSRPSVVDHTAKGGRMDTIRRYSMLIGGDWVDADEQFEIRSPATEEAGGQRGQGRPRARRPGGPGGQGRARRRPVAPDAAAAAGRRARRDSGTADRQDQRHCHPRGAGKRRDGPPGRDVPDRLLPRPPALLRRPGPYLCLRAARATDAGPDAGYRHRPPRAGRRVRGHRAVELPAAAGRVEDRPGAGRGQHDRGQARRAHPADAAGVRPDRAGVRAAAGGPERRARRGPGGRSPAGQPPGRAEDRLHRVDGRRPRDHADGRRQRETSDPGTGRQGAEHRPRRRRPGPRRGRHAVRRPDEPGPGV